MYLVTVDYSAAFHDWYIYRCIFFIWIYDFDFFAYVFLTWCSIFWYCSCWVVTHHIFIPDVLCWFTATLHIILSYKFYFVFSSVLKCISITCMSISIYIYMLVCGNDIFIDIFDISVNFLHISWWIFSHKCIVYKVFQ